MTEPRWVERWRERRDFLREQLALTSDAEQKFTLKKRIEEAEAMLVRWTPAIAEVELVADRARLPQFTSHLFGRNDELAMLDRAWAGEGTKVVTLIAWGGAGKTALVNEWRNQMLDAKLGADRIFDWTFYSQGVRDRAAVSTDNFLREALIFFGDPALAEGPKPGRDKAARLVQLVAERRTVLILDGLEPLQHPDKVQDGALRDEAIAVLLEGLAQTNAGLCVVTSRQRVRELVRFESTTARCHKLERLSKAAGAALLRSLLEDGDERKVASTQAEREEICETVFGHALTVQLLGNYIREALDDVRGWREISFEEADADQGGHAFRVMDAYVNWLAGAGELGRQRLAVLRLMGFFDRPATPGCVAKLREAPEIAGVTEAIVGLARREWSKVLAALERARLVTRGEHEVVAVRGYDEATARTAGLGFDERTMPEGGPSPWSGEVVAGEVLEAHPLVREYFARVVEEQSPAGWREGHGRLFEYLCASVPYWPEGTEGLQPLYQAVVHGCAAGRVVEVCKEVYRDRIHRGARFYSGDQLGAFNADLAAVAGMFESPWDRPSSALDEAHRAWLLNEVAFSLRALGRLGEALAPMRAGLERAVEREDWTNAAVAAGNLSELELTLGHTQAAVASAQQAVDHADRSGNDAERMVNRTTLADAWHQAGEVDEARADFEAAEAMQAEWQPSYPLLYSLPGHQYCELLLGSVERAAWGGPAEDSETGALVEQCAEVFARATRTLDWVHDKQASLLTIALDHLTLGRAAFYASLLRLYAPSAPAPELTRDTARQHLDAALAGLREAAAQEFIVRGLLTRAWLHHLDDDQADAAERLLAEAERLATRGPMPLHLADVHLHRARLFHDRSALAEARALIERHCYDRRLPELEHAERAAADWPNPDPTGTPSTSSRARASTTTNVAPSRGHANTLKFE